MQEMKYNEFLLNYKEYKKLIDKVIAFNYAKKLQTINDYLTMFKYSWYGKQAPRSAYDKLFKQINEIIKSEII